MDKTISKRDADGIKNAVLNSGRNGGQTHLEQAQSLLDAFALIDSKITPEAPSMPPAVSAPAVGTLAGFAGLANASAVDGASISTTSDSIVAGAGFSDASGADAQKSDAQ